MAANRANSANSVWRLAPAKMSFVGKDPLSMCRQIRANNGLTTGDPAAFDAFLRHLGNDQLIGFAFEGYRAQTENMPDDAQPPPMDRPTFVQLAQRWLQEGKARCGKWNGLISETISTSTTSPLVEEAADIQVDITVTDGEAKANVHMTGHTVQHGQDCFQRRDDYTVDAQDVPVDLTILVGRDLLSIPGFRVPNLPAPPTGVPGAPNIPAPPNILGSDTYSFALIVAEVQGKDHFEQRQPPGCGLTTGDNPYALRIPALQLAKPLDASNPDRLKDSDVQQTGSGKVSTEWDLARE